MKMVIVFLTGLLAANIAWSVDESQAEVATATEVTQSESTQTLNAEEQIPVLTKEAPKTAPAENYMDRLIMVVGLFSVICGGAFFWAKKYGRPRQNPQTQIKVLTQHYMGPKKSLAIVRVAGESILIGVTDNSINLIKSLSLLDDEIPESSPSANFEKLMQDQEKVQQMGSEEFSIRHIKDVVSLKLKGIRNDL
ncbi:MAG: FliO/MopB family protein [Bdellovibrionales bacterium]